MRRLAAAALLVLVLPAALGQRARDLGVPLLGTPGPHNAITDVPGVEVGHRTIVRGDGGLVKGQGPVRTGVTAILPRGRGFGPVFAAFYALNGNGDLTGTHWIDEGGYLETPVLITNTFSVGVVRDAAIPWMERNGHTGPFLADLWYAYPVVGETYDGILNDISGQHVTAADAHAALDSARSGPVAEGNVGGGTGMMSHGFKGGIGTSSRRLDRGALGTYTVGVLVQANHGGRGTFTVAGVPVGREITDLRPEIHVDAPPGGGGGMEVGPDDEHGSIIVVVATDAPLLPHQLERLARRVPIGIGLVGGRAGDGSGDIFLAFSTANPDAFSRTAVTTARVFPNDELDPLFEAVVQATEEAILNALVAARTMVGVNGNTAHALPHDRLREILRRYNRLRE